MRDRRAGLRRVRWGRGSHRVGGAVHELARRPSSQRRPARCRTRYLKRTRRDVLAAGPQLSRKRSQPATKLHSAQTLARPRPCAPTEPLDIPGSSASSSGRSAAPDPSSELSMRMASSWVLRGRPVASHSDGLSEPLRHLRDGGSDGERRPGRRSRLQLAASGHPSEDTTAS